MRSRVIPLWVTPLNPEAGALAFEADERIERLRANQLELPPYRGRFRALLDGRVQHRREVLAVLAPGQGHAAVALEVVAAQLAAQQADRLRVRRAPRESLYAPEDLPEQARRQVALGKLGDEVPGYIVFTTGISASSKAPDAAKDLMRFLEGPAVLPVIRSQGRDPA